MKRLFDILVSLTGLIILWPVFLVCALKVKKDGGPALYKAERTGKHGKPFKMLKFRSMCINADKMGGPSTANDDVRLTDTGKFLKRYQLDELPQLINVLKGEMSLVGPRPEVKHYTDMFTEKEKAILSVTPGMTDYASLWDFHEGELLVGATDSEKVYMEKVRPQKIMLQLKYVNERSFVADMKIIMETIRKVVS